MKFKKTRFYTIVAVNTHNFLRKCLIKGSIILAGLFFQCKNFDNYTTDRDGAFKAKWASCPSFVFKKLKRYKNLKKIFIFYV